MSLGLARLALRRTLPLGVVLLSLGLAALFLATTWRPDAVVQAALAGSVDPGAAASALARQGLWTALLATLAPFLVARVAVSIPAWRRGEVDWLLASGRSRAGIVAATYLGQLAAIGLFVLFVATAAELAAGPKSSARGLAARFSTPLLLVEPSQPLVRQIDPGSPVPDGVLRVGLLLVGGGRSAEVRMTVRSVAPPGGTSSVRARVASTGTLEIPLPSARGPFELTLEHTGGEALVAVRGDGIELLTPLGSPRMVSVRLALRAWLALAASIAVALGAGAWLGAPTAILVALGLPAAGLLAEGPLASLLPLAPLREALVLAGDDLAAPWPSARAIAVAALVVAAGLVLAAAGLRDWRRAP